MHCILDSALPIEEMAGGGKKPLFCRFSPVALIKWCKRLLGGQGTLVVDDDLGLNRVLIMGEARSGKTTLLRQIRACLAAEFSVEDRALFKPVLWSQLLQGMIHILGEAEQKGINQ